MHCLIMNYCIGSHMCRLQGTWSPLLTMSVIVVYYLVIIPPTIMPPDKIERLRASRTLNLHPERITDPLFQHSDFFDPRDLLQVRYEMIRCAAQGSSLKATAERFGTSIASCVRANRAFRERGLHGLMPQRCGPKGPHKITSDILDFVLRYRAEHGPVGAAKLVPIIADRFGVRIHPRGLYRALEKKTRNGSDERSA